LAVCARLQGHAVLCSKITDVHGIEVHWVRTRKFVYFRYIFRFLLHIARGEKRGARGHNSPGAESLRGAKKSQCHEHFLQYNTFLPKDLSFKHGGAKFVSCPRRYLISLSPCTSGLSSQNGEICSQKYLPISGKLSIANYLNQWFPTGGSRPQSGFQPQSGSRRTCCGVANSSLNGLLKSLIFRTSYINILLH